MSYILINTAVLGAILNQEANIATVAYLYGLSDGTIPTLSDEDAAFLMKTAHNLRTQDNRGTKHLALHVQRHARHGGLDASLTDDLQYVYQGEVVSDETAAAIEKARSEHLTDIHTEELGRIDLDDVEAYGYRDEWETVQVNFTEEGAREYLERDGHNLCSRGTENPRIYGESFHRNPEMLTIQRLIPALADMLASNPQPEKT